MFKYTDENKRVFALMMMREVSKHITSDKITHWAREIGISSGTLRTIKNQAESGDQKSPRISYECLVEILSNLKGALRPVVYIDTQQYVLSEDTKVLTGILCVKFAEFLERTDFRSISECSKVTGVHRTMVSKICMSDVTNMRLTVILSTLSKIGCDVSIGLEQVAISRTYKDTLSVTDMAHPTVTIATNIQKAARFNFENSDANIRDIIRNSGEAPEDVRLFLRGPASRRVPLSVALSIAKACGCTIKLSIS